MLLRRGRCGCRTARSGCGRAHAVGPGCQWSASSRQGDASDDRASRPSGCRQHVDRRARCLAIRALGPGLAGLLPLEQAFAAAYLRRVAREVEILIEGRKAAISDEHVGIVPKRRLSDNRKANTVLRQKRGCFERLATSSSVSLGKRSDCRLLGLFTECGLYGARRPSITQPIASDNRSWQRNVKL